MVEETAESRAGVGSGFIVIVVVLVIDLDGHQIDYDYEDDDEEEEDCEEEGDAPFGWLGKRQARRRKALPITTKSDRPIAAAQRMGLRKPSAARGMPMAL